MYVVFPPSQLRFQKPEGLIFFIFPASFPSEYTWFPSNTTAFTFAFGPSSITNESCSAAPPIGFASCFTLANGRAFAFNISRMIASTFLAFARS